MAEKISTLILKVDLDCRQCYKKIRKILCKLQDREKIRTISFDDKSKTITLSGTFDPLKLSCKLRCQGGKVIKDIQIKEDKPKDRNAAKSAGQAEKEKLVEPPPTEKEKPKEKLIDTVQVERQKPTEKPTDLARQPELVDVAAVTMTEIPSWPAGRAGPCDCCCHAPCYQGCYEGWRCCNCGRVYGWAGGAPPAGWCHGGPGYYGDYKTCQFFSEEDPSAACSIM